MNDKKTIPADVTDIILESISDGVFTVDHNWRIMSFNRAAELITGTPRHEAIGRFCWEVFRSNMCEGDCALKRTMKVGKSFVSSSTYIINSKKKQIPINVSTSLLKDEQGRVIGGVETFRDHSLVEELRRELSGNFQLGGMVSRSKVMQDLFDILEQVAQSDSTVLLEGETGTGKELLARAIHNLSLRKDHPFIGVNCGALPDSLLESELFGYRAGAFTDARTDKPGIFATGADGTILLDEIGDTSSAFQVRLLRVLEEGEYQPLGDPHRKKTNARIIAATNHDLKQLVENGAFRQDLYYRINIVTLKLPPLRERMEDLPLLIEHFIGKMNRLKGKMVSGLNDDAMALMLAHDYPGNIRELENIIEHAFVLCLDDTIGLTHLPVYLTQQRKTIFQAPTMQTAVQITEQEMIIKALEQAHYNRTAAAASLQMHKSTLLRKIKKLHITLPEQDGRSRQF
ncbi:MAG: sigma 54-interacting transcriptional regulator [Deltaproteobacteria bacterium]|nr:sigma 54-interacting transcriptional regulator [Deltaproteobacteria bacterium]